MPDFKLVDTNNRKLNYLRVSITDRCNLKCIYCVPYDLIPKLTHKEILSYEEILRIVRVGIKLGISKVRITGGEPLVRRGVDDFLKQLTAIEGLSDVSLTTNGVLLENHLDKIRSAGINRINVSLDTLNKNKFLKITGYDFFDRVWEGIQRAEKMGFDPIKLNVVPLKGINDDELVQMARLSHTHRFHIRFIEYMPMGNNRVKKGSHMLAPEIKRHVDPAGELIPVKRGMNDGPAERFKFKSAAGEIGFIRPISHHFCSTCNRLRLTASGWLRPCLLSDDQMDIKTLLRKKGSDGDIKKIFLQAVKQKPLEHHLCEDQDTGVAAQMCAIGG